MLAGTHVIHFCKPSDATSRFIRFYAHRESNLGSSVLIHPVPARSEHILDFQFGDEIRIHSFRDDVTRPAETPALIGLQTHRRVEQLISGHIESFSIFFQPAALCLLYGLPTMTVTNADHDARGVLGRSVGDLKERLGNCVSFHERVELADAFVMSLVTKSLPPDTIELAATEIKRQHGVCRMDALAQDTGLSSRTFERRFKHSVGLSPKTYARIVRFQSALRKKAACPRCTWVDIAYQYGYYDQMHMVHDFRQLSTENPSELMRHLANVFHHKDLKATDSTYVLL